MYPLHTILNKRTYVQIENATEQSHISIYSKSIHEINTHTYTCTHSSFDRQSLLEKS